MNYIAICAAVDIGAKQSSKDQFICSNWWGGYADKKRLQTHRLKTCMHGLVCKQKPLWS